MSMQVKMFRTLPTNYLPEIRRQAWGRLFGLGIRATRTETGLTIEEAAQLAGFELSEWLTVEDGHVPQDVNKLRSMASVLQVSYEKILSWVVLCREAWEL